MAIVQPDADPLAVDSRNDQVDVMIAIDVLRVELEAPGSRVKFKGLRFGGCREPDLDFVVAGPRSMFGGGGDIRTKIVVEIGNRGGRTEPRSGESRRRGESKQNNCAADGETSPHYTLRIPLPESG